MVKKSKIFQSNMNKIIILLVVALAIAIAFTIYQEIFVYTDWLV